MTNILFLTVDSLRADYVFGPRAPESLETLPRLARDGLVFTNAFADAPHTKQSFLSILSGTYPWLFDGEVGFEPERPHVAEVLSGAGYATAGFHTNTYLSPTYNYDRGFDHYLGRDSASDERGGGVVETAYNSAVERALATRGLSAFVHWAYETAGRHLGVQLGSSLYRPAAALNESVVDWSRTASQPAFIWAHYMDVHNPYYPHEGTVSEGISRRRAIKLFHRVNDLRGDASDSDIETLERLYRGEIEYLDRELGVLLDRLDETLGLDETLIVFTADHGEAFDEHGQVFHPGSALYDENVHVPMLLHGPGIEPGTVETPVANVDLVPTILRQVGVDVPPVVDGEDIVAFARQPPEERLVFTESFAPEDGNVMVTDGRFKRCRDCATGESVLYDRWVDQPEDHDCSEQYPEICEKLDAAIDEHIRTVSSNAADAADVEVTEDVRLQLKKLGYDE